MRWSEIHSRQGGEGTVGGWDGTRKNSTSDCGHECFSGGLADVGVVPEYGAVSLGVGFRQWTGSKVKLKIVQADRSKGGCWGDYDA